MSDEDMEQLLETAVKRERRLTQIEESIKHHDEFMKRLETQLDTMIGWFRGMVFTVIGAVLAAAVLEALRIAH